MKLFWKTHLGFCVGLLMCLVIMIVSMEPEHEQSKLIKDLKLRKMFILRFLHFLTRNDFLKRKWKKVKGSAIYYLVLLVQS